MTESIIKSGQFSIISILALIFCVGMVSDGFTQQSSFENPCFGEHYVQFDYDTVVKCLEAQLAKEPENVDTILQLSRLYRITKNRDKLESFYDKAFEILDKKAKQSKLSLKEKIDYAGVLNIKRATPESGKNLDSILAEFEEEFYGKGKLFDIDTMVNMSGIYRNKQKYGKSIEILDRTISSLESGDRQDKNRIIGSLMGLEASIYFNNLKSEESTKKGYQILEKAVELCPNDMVIKNLLAYYAGEKNDFPRAIKLYKEMINQVKYDKYFNKPYRQLAQCYELTGDMKQAESTFLEDIDHYPAHFQTYKKLLAFYQSRGENEKFISLCKKGIEAAKLSNNNYFATFFENTIKETKNILNEKK
ncbi:MAG: hypothetical protein A2161_00120 [Candidatus Schekmanbacteria bacterium RBG_13_48_7]|uniref:Uncharacterized protein n=1 Tax=Candidatus Schekmanbacteria bacterium RBG_13_48_7 TaxID=1817878 RepID=A0A1F7RXG8_9BACT|nr:MAG: hypothetical protein A2161_00120 [Candidatus Schekmanbacteria bacterium RBG_13_48_7]